MTTAALTEQIVSQLQGSLGQQIPFLPKAFLRVLAKVLAGVFALLQKYAGWISLQLFVAHASDKETTINGRKIRPLVEWGRLVGVGDPDPATRAELWITATVLNVDPSKSISAGQQVIRSETGFVYLVVAAVAMSASSVQVRIRATYSPNNGDGSGSAGNLLPGDIVEFANTPPGVGTKATVHSQEKTAADAESIDRYRGRIYQKMQQRPQGGAYADYRQWGEEVEGIVNIYPYAGDPGEVDIYVEADEASSGSPDGIPTGPQLSAVGDSIEMNEAGLATRRPVSAAKNVLPISRRAFGVRVYGLTPETSTTTQAITDGCDEYFRSLEPYIVGLSALPRKDRATQAALSGLIDAIVNANGATIAKVELLVSGSPVSAYTLDPGEKAKLVEPIDFA